MNIQVSRYARQLGYYKLHHSFWHHLLFLYIEQTVGIDSLAFDLSPLTLKKLSFSKLSQTPGRLYI